MDQLEEEKEKKYMEGRRKHAETEKVQKSTEGYKRKCMGYKLRIGVFDKSSVAGREGGVKREWLSALRHTTTTRMDTKIKCIHVHFVTPRRGRREVPPRARP